MFKRGEKTNGFGSTTLLHAEVAALLVEIVRYIPLETQFQVWRGYAMSINDDQCGITFSTANDENKIKKTTTDTADLGVCFFLG